MISRRSSLAGAFIAALGLSACASDDGASDTATTPVSTASAAEASGPAADASIAVVSPDEAAQTIADPPDDLVILDVRTSEEFAEGHIDGAVMIDFYRDDFGEQIAGLDPEVPYLVYCRSGNRSGQTTELMAALGFESVDDVDGGIVAWEAAGLPVTAEL